MSSTTGKNRSILQGLVAEAPAVTETPKAALGEDASSAARPPERLSARFTSLSQVTAGDRQEKTLQLVDPGPATIGATTC